MGTQHPPIRVKSTLRPFHNTPDPPFGLTITCLLSNKVSLSWSDNSGDESGFKIQRKKGATGTYADIRTMGANVTSYTDNDSALRDGMLYYYRVCATNAAGDSAFSNEVSGTTPLAKPTSATATAVLSSQINLTWIDNSASETGYKIERKNVDWHLCADRPGGCKCAKLQRSWT
jgi:fibronectin type 3 domain-containing protein